MRDPVEFEVGGKSYRATHMDAKTQMHIARRVQPLLVALVPALLAASPGGKLAPGSLLNLDIGAMLPGLKSAADMLAEMSDENFDYLQSRCLARVQRRKDNDAGWANIWSAQADRLIFDDIQGHEVQIIMVKVLVAELAPFFVGLASSFSEASPA